MSKSETISSEQKENPKQYDLEERTSEFARRVRAFIKLLNKTLANIKEAKQLMRASDFGFVLCNLHDIFL